jgi:hypothetical protein
MGVDVARFGTDHTVLAFRQGRSARVIPFQRYLGDDTMIVANHVAIDVSVCPVLLVIMKRFKELPRVLTTIGNQNPNPQRGVVCKKPLRYIIGGCFCSGDGERI